MRKLYLNVHLEQDDEKLFVGELSHIERTIYFEYSQEFIDTGIELSPFKLPLKSGVQTDPELTFHGLHGVFNDSLPDGWGMLLMDRHFRKQGLHPEAISPLERLAYIGHRGMGALCYEPATKLGEPIREDFNLDILAKECEQVLQGSADDILPELIIAGGSPGGARPKVLVHYNADSDKMIYGTLLPQEGFTSYIVKFSALTDIDDVAAVEYAYALMASAAGIDMPGVKLFKSRDNKAYFGIERFDINNTRRIHMHTLSGLLHADYRVPNCDYTDFIKATQLLTIEHGDVEEAFRRMVFNIVCHNRDDHTKNFSYLLGSKGWRLSPAYDLTHSSGVAGEHTMTIAGEGANPQREDIKRVAKAVVIDDHTTSQITEQVMTAVNDWPQYAKKAGVNKSTATELKRIFDNTISSIQK